jgi:hypothetical protein
MAQVKLHLYDCEQEGGLPDVCMVCGETTEVSVPRTFYYVPGWTYWILIVGLLPAAILQIVLRKSMRVFTPLCDQHYSHFTKRLWLSNILGLLVVFGLIGAMILLILSQEPQNRNDSVFKFAAIGTFIAAVLCLVGAIVINFTGTRVRYITDREIVFTDAHGSFKEAYLDQENHRKDRIQQRREQKRLREAANPRKSRQYDDDDDDFDD